MKKLFAICLLLATTLTVRAQDMSFEETVKYINDKIASGSQKKDFIFSAKKDGTFSYYRVTLNLFDLYTAKEPNGIYLRNSTIVFCLGEYLSTDFPEFNTQKDAERVYNALLHLRSLCTKTKDPFDK